jgi:two-component system chemotaxis response regulator CheY
MADILIIDDEPLVRTVLRLALELSGHGVREAGDGAAGLRAYAERPADVVVCDVFMPEADGLEVLRELRQRDPAAKVVAMSGGGERSGMDFLGLARQLGAAGVLRKPFTRAEVEAAVRAALGGPD